MAERPTYLFSEYDTSKLLAAQQQAILEAVDSYGPDEFLAANPDALVADLSDRFRVDVPALRDDITQDTREIQIDQSRNPDVYIRDRSRPFYVKGTSVSFHIPFRGDEQFFRCQPSTYSLNPPHVSELRSDELVIVFSGTDLDAPRVRGELDRRLGEIRSHLETLRKDVGDFNERLPELIRRRIDDRRTKLLKDRSLSVELGFPARRVDAPKTYTTPVVRRRISARPARTGESTPAERPEPTLHMDEYEHILSVIQQMVAVMERSPSAFSGMSEEHLRQHFLVQLNGQYEGQATGETFNFEGKTDILVRVDGRNIFIAECKIWSGEKALTEAIDQLLRYASWRDTKLALLVFVRTKDFTDVVRKVEAAASAHPNVKKRLAFSSETGFRFVVRHKDDPERDLVLTTLAFHVPT